jgi:hypothetical protein
VTDWGRRVFIGALLGALLGVLVGLGLARVVWPPAATTPVPSSTPTGTTLQATATSSTVAAEPTASLDEAVVLVGALYALDRDLERARERLVALGVDDPGPAVAELALRHAAAGSSQLATDLATLAAALGHQESDLLAYVATATPTHTPPPTPTTTPRPTQTPTATPTPTAPPSPTSTPPPAPSRVPTRRPASPAPPTATPRPAAATPLALEWDYRVNMLEPPVRVVPADAGPGERYWRLVRLKWLKEFEGGNTLLYISTLDEQGEHVWGQEVIVENGGHLPLYTQPKPGEPYGTNTQMNSTLNSYQVFVGGDLPSDRVTGLGLGEWYGGLDHTSFILVFQRTAN